MQAQDMSPKVLATQAVENMQLPAFVKADASLVIEWASIEKEIYRMAAIMSDLEYFLRQ